MNRIIWIVLFLFITCHLSATCSGDIQCYHIWNTQTQQFELICQTVACPDDDLPSEPFPSDPGDPGPDPADIPGGGIMDNIAERCLRANHAANLASFEMRPRLGPGQQFNPVNGRWGNYFQGVVELASDWSDVIQNAKFTVEWTETPGTSKVYYAKRGELIRMQTNKVDDSSDFIIRINGTGDCYDDTLTFTPYFRSIYLKGFKRFYEKKFLRQTRQTGLAERSAYLTGCGEIELQRTVSYTDQYSFGQSGGASVTLIELSYQFNFMISRTVTETLKFAKPYGKIASLWRFPTYDEYLIDSWDYDWLGNKADIRLMGTLRRDYETYEFVIDGLCDQ